MKTMKLKDLCHFNPPKKEARLIIREEEEVSFLPMEDLNIFSKYVIPQKKRIFGDVVKGYTYFKEGDLLVAKITPCFENGKMGIVKNLHNGIGFGSTEYIVLRTKGMVLAEWIFYFLSLPFVREHGQELMTGAVGHKRIPKDYLENLDIPVPSISDQHNILESLVSTLDEISECESIVEQQLELLNELEKSLIFEAMSQQNERS